MLAVEMYSRAEQYRRWGLRAQQRATEAQDTKIKAAFEDVASGWFALAAQVDWLEREHAHAQWDDKKE